MATQQVFYNFWFLFNKIFNENGKFVKWFVVMRKHVVLNYLLISK